MSKSKQKSTKESKNNTILRRVSLSLITSIWVVVVFMVLQIMVGVVVNTIVESGHKDILGNPVVAQTLLSVFIYVMAIIIAISVPKKLFKDKTSLTDLGIKRKLPNWTDVWLAPTTYIVSLLAIAVVMKVIECIVPSFNIEQAQQLGFSPSMITTQVELLLVYFTLAVLAPVAEELLFRGYLFGKINRYLSTPVTVLLTAFVFSALHLGLGALVDLQWNVAIATFVLGIALGSLRSVTGNLWASIILHMIQNTVAFLILFALPFSIKL